MKNLQILIGDNREILPSLPAASVHCCITSPPYWGLRDYGHRKQIGLEKTPEEYVAELVAVFRDVRRVLRDDGTLWLNLGDSYATGGGRCGNKPGGGSQGKEFKEAWGDAWKGYRPVSLGWTQPNRMPLPGLKAKDLIGVPWRVAFALQADGWYLRSEIIWHKPNCMPESVRDRPTLAHERIFLLSKSPRYHYDAAAIAEPCQSGASDVAKMLAGLERIDAKHFHNDPGRLAKAGPQTNIGRKRAVGGLRFAMGQPGPNSRMFKDRDPAHLVRSGNKERSFEGRLNHRSANIPWEGLRRNKRTVWTIAAQPYHGAHFATFPERLIEPCLLAGCPAGGVVIDPFAGSGTVGAAALKRDRGAILIELNPAYRPLIEGRLTDVCNPLR